MEDTNIENKCLTKEERERFEYLFYIRIKQLIRRIERERNSYPIGCMARQTLNEVLEWIDDIRKEET